MSRALTSSRPDGPAERRPGCDDGGVVVGVLTAMGSELRPFVRSSGLARQGADGTGGRSGATYGGGIGRHTVIATIMGVGMTGAARTAERLLATGEIDRMVVVGIAGGLDPGLPIGAVVVPEEVVDGVTGAEYPTSPLGGVAPQGRLVTYNELQTDPELMVDLQRQGFAAIDMETAAVAAVCDRRHCPLTVFRAISDSAINGPVDAAVGAMARPDGSPDVGAALRYLLRRPWRTPALLALGRDATRAAKAAADAALAAFGADAPDATDTPGADPATT
jgi:adenosylhomocysteine nucleosidase